VCDPVSATFALQAGSAVVQHGAESKAVGAENRAKLKNFQLDNEQYLHEVMLEDNNYKNDVQEQDINQDLTYRAMVDQWMQQDQQLDKIFQDGNLKIEGKLIDMYQQGYAGEQSGKTAGRLAGQSARSFGQEKAAILSKMMLAEEEVDTNKDITRNKAKVDSMKLYENVRFAPIHGPTPMAPDLKAKPGVGGLLLNIGMAALGTYGPGGISSKLKTPPIGVGGAGQAAANATAGSASSLTALGGTSFNQAWPTMSTTGMQQLTADPTFQNAFTKSATQDPLGANLSFTQAGF